MKDIVQYGYFKDSSILITFPPDNLVELFVNQIDTWSNSEFIKK